MKMKKNLFYIILTALLFLAFLTACSIPNKDYTAYILSYGVGKYIEDVSGRPNLAYTVKDSADIFTLFSEYGYQGQVRTDSAATKAQLMEDIEETAGLLNENDVFVFYFSGHAGQYSISEPGGEAFDRDDKVERLLMYGSVYESGGRIQTDEDMMLSDDELKSLLSQIPVRKKVVIIDACNSGGFIGTSASVDQVPQDYTGGTIGITGNNALKSLYLYFAYPHLDNADIAQDEAFVISAAGEREYSYEDAALENGVFTHYFLDSAVHGDRDNNGAVTVTEAYRYTFDRIMSEWNNPNHSAYRFLPHVSAGPLDLILF